MSEQEIYEACERLGKQFSIDLKDEKKYPVFIGVMKGGLPFMMDLIKNIEILFKKEIIQLMKKY